MEARSAGSARTARKWHVLVELAAPDRGWLCAGCQMYEWDYQQMRELVRASRMALMGPHLGGHQYRVRVFQF